MQDGVGKASLFKTALQRAWCRLIGFDIFISYSQRDGLCYTKALEQRLGTGKRPLLVFRDETGLDGDGALRPELVREVRRCKVLVVVVTSGACESRWVTDEVAERIENGKLKWLGLFARPAAIVPLILPPLNAQSLPGSFPELADYLWVEEAPQTISAGGVSEKALDRINRSFTGLRRLAWLKLTVVALLGVFLAFGLAIHQIQLSKFKAIDRKTHEEKARLSEQDLRFSEAELEFARAFEIDPTAAAELIPQYRIARSQRALTPVAHYVVPRAWRLLEMAEDQDAPLVLLHNSESKRLALVSGGRVSASFEIADDSAPVATAWNGAVAVFAGGKLWACLPGHGDRFPRSVETSLASGYYRPGMGAAELMISNGRLLVYGEEPQAEHPLKVLSFQPESLALQKEIALYKPAGRVVATLITDTNSTTGTNRLAVMAWQPEEQPYKLNVGWLDSDGHLMGEPKSFEIPNAEFGVAVPLLDKLEISPDGGQAFVRLYPIAFDKAPPMRWLALDLIYPRTPLVLEPNIRKFAPLPACQSHEAVFLVENRELKALACRSLVVLDRPVITLAHDVSDFSVTVPPSTGAGEFEMVALSGRTVEVYRDGKPIYRFPLNDVSQRPESVQVRHSPGGRWVAVAYCVDDTTANRELRIFRTTVPTPKSSIPPYAELARQMDPVIEPLSPH